MMICKQCGGKYAKGTWRDKYGEFCSSWCERESEGENVDWCHKTHAEEMLDNIQWYWAFSGVKFEGHLERVNAGGKSLWGIRSNSSIAHKQPQTRSLKAA